MDVELFIESLHPFLAEDDEFGAWLDEHCPSEHAPDKRCSRCGERSGDHKFRVWCPPFYEEGGQMFDPLDE